MAKIEVILNDIKANGATDKMINDADNSAVHRDYFVAGKVFGGEKDAFGGKWEARKVAFKDADKNEIVSVVWAVCYVVDDKSKGCLTKSFLLSEGRCDADGTCVAPKGDIRTWADDNIVDGVLNSEWTAKLAEALNKRGLVMEKDKYQQKKKAGGVFVATYFHPFFADTYSAE